MNELEQIKNENKLISLFVELAEIPSPSLQEEKLSDKILEILSINGINAGQDKYGNIIAKIPAHREYKDVPPLLLSAHMDVVGGSDKVNVKLSRCGRYIETDKTRTLGADDKVGVAGILDFAIDINALASNIKHGPIEIVFTRDEEKGMTGIENLDTSKLASKYAIIADGETLGELNDEGASYTNVFIKVSEGKGGHSGMNISEKDRINAIKVLTELDSMIPQGVFKQDERGVVTSINVGSIIGGTADVYLAETFKSLQKAKNIDEKYSAKNILETVAKEANTNVINTEACSSYSIRSSEPDNEQELINLITSKVKELNKKYNGDIKITLHTEQHLKPFVKSHDTFLSDVIVKAGELNKLDSTPKSFHAGAETHVFANEKKNSKNESFTPVIIGLANLIDIHSSNEKLDWRSFIKGRKFLEDIVVTFAQEYKNQN